MKKLRNERGITQEQLAHALDIPESTIRRLETTENLPRKERINQIADYFEVSVDYLLGRSSNKEESSVGRAFYGGADQYTEDELEIARAAAQAAVEAYRKGLNKKK
ncbi:helix-turn-helix domain-containing protein [Paenibacillus anseongensis]|uniref:helix-turn-helix domain-containing protein n=1 Tax=Paenibacillus anseongense TaxID=2682845 RepID=UPI003B848780